MHPNTVNLATFGHPFPANNSSVNNSLQLVHLSERYLARRNVNAQTAHRNLYDDIRACNLIWCFNGLRGEEFAQQMMRLCDESGHKIDGQMIDTATLIHILENAANLGPHFNPVDQHMAPVAQLVCEEMFDNEMRHTYVNPEFSLPMRSVVDKMAECMRPVGILAYDEDSLQPIPGMDRFRSIILSRGYVNSLAKLCLSLPVSRTIDIANTRGSRIGTESTLYFVMAPNNELLMGQGVGTNAQFTTGDHVYGPSLVMNGRILDQERQQIVYDQAYTGAFIFSTPTDTETGILEKLRARCLANTSCHSVADVQYRGLAIIRLGTVPIISDLILKTTNGDGSESFMLDTFHFSPGKWNVSYMWYKRPHIYDGDENLYNEEVNAIKGDQSSAVRRTIEHEGGDPDAFQVPVAVVDLPAPAANNDQQQLANTEWPEDAHSDAEYADELVADAEDGVADVDDYAYYVAPQSTVLLAQSPCFSKALSIQPMIDVPNKVPNNVRKRSGTGGGGRTSAKRHTSKTNTITGSLPPI